MHQKKSRGGSYGPYCCLLFLMGLGFLVAGVGSGMVMNALASLMSNSPDSTESLNTLGVWSAFTFGSLGLGSLGINYYGVKNSTLWFGAILILCGVVGLVMHYSGGGTADSGNVVWVVMNFIAEITGSLLYTSVASIGFGLLLVTITSLTVKTAQTSPTSNRGQMIVCSRCGHSNPVWYAVCEKCRSQITLGNYNNYN